MRHFDSHLVLVVLDPATKGKSDLFVLHGLHQVEELQSSQLGFMRTVDQDRKTLELQADPLFGQELVQLLTVVNFDI